jgi:hypothetical protein
VNSKAVGEVGRARAPALLVGLLLWTVAGCSAGVDPAAGRSYLIGHMHARLGSAHRVPPNYSTLADLLPNVLYAQTTGQPRAIVDAVAVGRFTHVRADRGFYTPQGDAPGGVETPFDDPKAEWKTVRMSFRVERALDGSSKPGETLNVGFALGGDADLRHIEAGFPALGRVVVFLRKGSPVFAYDQSLLAVLEDGGMVATVDDIGRLSLPFLDLDRAIHLLVGSETLMALQEQSSRAPRVVARS